MRGLLFRPWRVAAGSASAWRAARSGARCSCVAGLGLLSWAWDCGMRRAIGVRLAPLKSLGSMQSRPSSPSSCVGVRRLRRLLDRFPDPCPDASRTRSVIRLTSSDWAWSSVDDRRDGDILGVDTPVNDELLRAPARPRTCCGTTTWSSGGSTPATTSRTPLIRSSRTLEAGWSSTDRSGIAATSGDSSVIPECPPGRELRQAGPGDRHTRAVVGRRARALRQRRLLAVRVATGGSACPSSAC